MPNPAFETVEEETTEVISAPALPEIPDDVDIATAEQLVVTIEETAKHLPAISKYTIEAYGELGKLLKVDAEKLDKIRLARTKPLREEVDAMNAGYNKVITRLKTVITNISVIANKYVDEQRAIEAAEQARLNAEAEQARIAAAQAAEKARKDAEAARAQGDERTAVKLEQKANLQEVKAESIVPQSIEQTTGKVQTSDGGSLSFGGGKWTWDMAGWPKSPDGKRKPLPCTSPLLKGLVGDLSKLPPGLQFVLRHADLNPVYLNASFGREEFPAPFTKVKDYSSSRRS